MISPISSLTTAQECSKAKQPSEGPLELLPLNESLVKDENKNFKKTLEYTFTLKTRTDLMLKTFSVFHEAPTIGIHDSHIEEREKIKLNGVNVEKAELAKLLAKAIKKNFTKRASNEKIPKSTTEAIFKEYLNQVIKQLDIEKDCTGSITDDELLTLTVFYSLKTKLNPDGFMDRMPTNFFDYANPNFDKRISVLAKHYLVDVLKLNTARKIEAVENWGQHLKDGGLISLMQMFKGRSIPSILKLSFPGFLEGENPPIREWVLNSNAKWTEKEGLELAKKACAWKLKYDLKVVKEDSSIDSKKLKEIEHWGEVFHYDTENGFSGMMDSCPYTKTTEDAIRLGIQNLKLKELIGLDENQIHPWQLQHNKMWEGESGKTLVKQIAEYLVEKKLKLVNPDKTISAEKIKNITDWGIQFRNESSHSLKNSVCKNAYEALKLKYPHLFGWEKEQIKPWEIRQSGMWDGSAGVRLFTLAFAYSLYDNGLGKFDPKNTTPLSFTRAEFVEWKSKVLTNWREFIEKEGLAAAIKKAASSNITKAFELLLGNRIRKGEIEQLGKTPILLDDIYDSKPTLNKITTELIKSLEKYPKEIIILNKAIDEDDYMFGKHRSELSNVAGTCLEPILQYHPPSKESSIKFSAYEALLASVFNTSSKGTQTSSKDRYTALEKILFSYQSSDSTSIENKKNYILADNKLYTFLKFIKDDLINELDLEDDLKRKLQASLEMILEYRDLSPRDILINAIEINPKFNREKNLISLLNKIIETTLDKVLVYELDHIRNTTEPSKSGQVIGHPTDFYSNIISRFEEEDELPEEDNEPLSESNTQNQAPVDYTKLSVAIEETSKKLTEDELDELDSFIDVYETQRIYDGRQEEDPKILQTLVELGINDSFRNKFLRNCVLQEPIEQLKIIYQIGDRAKSRLKDRYNYGSLRVKNLPSASIKTIVSENGEVDFNLIDKDLFYNLPPNWPQKSAMPLLFWNDVLYIGIYKSMDKASLENLSKNLSTTIEPIKINDISWSNWEGIHKAEIPETKYNPRRPLIWQDEEERVLVALSLLRQSISITLKEYPELLPKRRFIKRK